MKKTQIEQGSDPLYDLRSDIEKKLPKQGDVSPWAMLKTTLKDKYDRGEMKSPVGALLALQEAGTDAMSEGDPMGVSNMVNPVGAVGSLRPRKYSRVQEMLQGNLPHELSNEEFSKIFKKAGPDTRGTGIMLNGRWVQDAINPHATPQDIIRWGQQEYKVPLIEGGVIYQPSEGKAALGSFNKKTDRVLVHPDQIASAPVVDPKALEHGVLAHEILGHGVDSKLFPNQKWLKEYTARGTPKQNWEEAWLSDFFHPDREVNFMTNLESPRNAKQLERVLRKYPRVFSDDTQLHKAMNREFGYANHPLTGNPWVELRMRSFGHTRLPSFERDFARRQSAIEAARNGLEVHPDLFALNDIKQAYKQYRSNVVQVPKKDIGIGPGWWDEVPKAKPSLEERVAAVNPWLVLGGGTGLAGGLAYYGNKQRSEQPKAAVKADEKAQGIAEDSDLSTDQWQDLLEGISKRRGQPRKP